MMKKQFVFFFLFLSCRDHHFPQYTNEREISSNKSTEVVFQGNLKALDATSRGHYLLWLKKNQFYARIIFLKAPKKSRIHQYIHIGPQCPDFYDDQNEDRKLNFVETISVVGPVLIPLDGNLSSQGEGFSWFPSTNERGSYYYSRSTNYKSLLQDLDPNSESVRPFFTKLTPTEPLALHRRVLLIYREDSKGLWAIACSPIHVKVSD